VLARAASIPDIFVKILLIDSAVPVAVEIVQSRPAINWIPLTVKTAPVSPVVETTVILSLAFEDAKLAVDPNVIELVAD